MSLINNFRWQVLTNQHLEPFQKFHPKCVWSRDVTNQTYAKWQVLTNEQLAFTIYLFILCQVASSNKRTTCNPYFHQKCHANVSSQEMLPIKMCEVASSNQRTSCIYLLPYVKRHVLTNEQLAFILLLSLYAK